MILYISREFYFYQIKFQIWKKLTKRIISATYKMFNLDTKN